MKFKEVKPLKLCAVSATIEDGPEGSNTNVLWLRDPDDADMGCIGFWSKQDREDVTALRDWLNRVLDSYPAREGWKMVPVEPTDEMLRAGVEFMTITPGSATRKAAGYVYEAMLTAAPAQDEQGEGE